MPMFRGRASKLASHLHKTLLRNGQAVSHPLMMIRLLSLGSSMDINPSTINGRASAHVGDAGADNTFHDTQDDYNSLRSSREEQRPPRYPIPNRPLRDRTENFSVPGKDDVNGRYSAASTNKHNRGGRAGAGVGSNVNRPSTGNSLQFGELNMKKFPKNAPTETFTSRKKHTDDFLERFKLSHDKGESSLPKVMMNRGEQDDAKDHEPALEPPPQDADEIFKKMKETGLIPNAVAMLDGLCKDGLVQEAMKLFSLMREKGTIPEVVIYTAVVEGFCKAQKLDDAIRIFRKMQSNGISPNAFSYSVLIQGLYKGKRLEDALDFCVEMLDDGHSPNLATFTGLVDGFCREKSVDKARSMIGMLKQKGFSFDERAVREYLDKKGPFLPLVWEAILGKKSALRFF